jgi:signal transduction histidine kinase
LRQAVSAARSDGDVAAERAIGADLDQVLALLDELRSIAHGIYPPVLADAGLVPALESLARSGPAALSIDSPSLPRLDPAVEHTVYLAVREAVVLAGAGARCHASVAKEDGRLHVDIAGCPSYRVDGLADRVDALGGEIHEMPDGARMEIPCE